MTKDTRPHRGEGMSVPPRLAYSPREVAALLGLGKSKVYDMLRRQELPYVKLGSLTRIPGTALQQWLETQVQAGK